MTEVIGDTIEAKLVASGDRDASPCIVCDRYSSSRVQAKASRSFCVCPHCLKSADFDAKLAARAEKVVADAEAIMTDASKLRERAANVRMLIGKVKAPTFEEWLDAEAEEDVMARSRVTKEELKKTLAKVYEQCGGHEPADWDDQGNAEDAARDEFFLSLSEHLLDDLPF
jgi:hypothetical protein